MWISDKGSDSVRVNRMIAEGAGHEWSKRHRRDKLDLWRALELDIIVIPRPGRREGRILEIVGGSPNA